MLLLIFRVLLYDLLQKGNFYSDSIFLCLIYHLFYGVYYISVEEISLISILIQVGFYYSIFLKVTIVIINTIINHH